MTDHHPPEPTDGPTVTDAELDAVRRALADVPASDSAARTSAVAAAMAAYDDLTADAPDDTHPPAPPISLQDRARARVQRLVLAAAAVVVVIVGIGIVVTQSSGREDAADTAASAAIEKSDTSDRVLTEPDSAAADAFGKTMPNAAVPGTSGGAAELQPIALGEFGDDAALAAALDAALPSTESAAATAEVPSGAPAPAPAPADASPLTTIAGRSSLASSCPPPPRTRTLATGRVAGEPVAVIEAVASDGTVRRTLRDLTNCAIRGL